MVGGGVLVVLDVGEVVVWPGRLAVVLVVGCGVLDVVEEGDGEEPRVVDEGEVTVRRGGTVDAVVLLPLVVLGGATLVVVTWWPDVVLVVGPGFTVEVGATEVNTTSTK